MKSEKKMDQSSSADAGHSRSSMRKVIIAFAIIEALVLVPVILYLMFR